MQYESVKGIYDTLCTGDEAAPRCVSLAMAVDAARAAYAGALANYRTPVDVATSTAGSATRQPYGNCGAFTAYRTCDRRSPRLESVLLSPSTIPKAAANCMSRCMLLPGVGCCELELGATSVRCNAYNEPWISQSADRSDMAAFCNVDAGGRWAANRTTPAVLPSVTADPGEIRSAAAAQISTLSIASLVALAFMLCVLLYCACTRCCCLASGKSPPASFAEVRGEDHPDSISGLVEALRNEMDDKINSLTSSGRDRVMRARTGMNTHRAPRGHIKNPPMSMTSFNFENQDEDAFNFAWDDTDFQMPVQGSRPSSPLGAGPMPPARRTEPLYDMIRSTSGNGLFEKLTSPPIGRRGTKFTPRRQRGKSPTPAKAGFDQNFPGAAAGSATYETASSAGGSSSMYETASNLFPFANSPLSQNPNPPPRSARGSMASHSHNDDALYQIASPTASVAGSHYEMPSPSTSVRSATARGDRRNTVWGGSEFGNDGDDGAVYEVASPTHTDARTDPGEALYEIAASQVLGRGRAGGAAALRFAGLSDAATDYTADSDPVYELAPDAVQHDAIYERPGSEGGQQHHRRGLLQSPLSSAATLELYETAAPPTAASASARGPGLIYATTDEIEGNDADMIRRIDLAHLDMDMDMVMDLDRSEISDIYEDFALMERDLEMSGSQDLSGLSGLSGGDVYDVRTMQPSSSASTVATAFAPHEPEENNNNIYDTRTQHQEFNSEEI